jgi:hypothetical protein
LNITQNNLLYNEFDFGSFFINKKTLKEIDINSKNFNKILTNITNNKLNKFLEFEENIVEKKEMLLDEEEETEKKKKREKILSLINGIDEQDSILEEDKIFEYDLKTIIEDDDHHLTPKNMILRINNLVNGEEYLSVCVKKIIQKTMFFKTNTQMILTYFILIIFEEAIQGYYLFNTLDNMIEVINAYILNFDKLNPNKFPEEGKQKKVNFMSGSLKNLFEFSIINSSEFQSMLKLYNKAEIVQLNNHIQFEKYKILNLCNFKFKLKEKVSENEFIGTQLYFISRKFWWRKRFNKRGQFTRIH